MSTTNLITFTDVEGHAVHIPTTRVSHWTLDTGGGMRIWALGGGVHFPADKAQVLEQLEAAGLLPDTCGTAADLEVKSLTMAPEISSRPPAGTTARHKGKQR